MHLIATDLQVGVVSTVPGKIEEEGTCTILARKLIGYVQQLPKTHPIVFSSKGNVLTVKTEGFSAQFPIGEDEEFPSLPKLPAISTLVLSADHFCASLTRTLFAAARDDTRPEIHSVYMRSGSEVLTMAATDSFRLTEDVVVPDSIAKDVDLLLPLGAAREAVRLFADQESVTLNVHDGHVTFVGDGVELSSRLVDGSYPDYKQIIPDTFSVTGTVDREEFVRALKTLVVFLSKESRRVRLSVEPGEGRILLTTGSGDVGEGSVSLEFDGEGKNLEVLFNIQYVLDSLQYVTTERVQLQFVGNSEPAVFKPTGDNSTYTYVVMPIQA